MKMPYKKDNLPYDVLSESQLQSYKIQYISTQELKLVSGDTQMEGMKPGESQPPTPPDFDRLSNIIKSLNEMFGIDFTDEELIANAKKLAAMGEALQQAKAHGDEKTAQEILNMTYTGPLPEMKEDGTYTQIY